VSEITRYLLRQITGATLFVLVTLTATIWLTQSLRLIEIIVNRGVDLSVFLYMTLLLLPSFLVILLPVSLFAAILFVYNRMLRDSELIVMRTCGLGQGRLSLAALLLAGIIVVLGYSVTLYTLPTGYREFKDMQFLLRNNYATAVLREGVFNDFDKGLTVYIRARETSGELLGMLIHDNRERDRPVTFMAERGALVQTDDGPRIALVNGNRQEIQRGTGELSILYFDRYNIELDRIGEKIEDRWREPRERYLNELLFPDDSPADQFNRTQLIAEGHHRLVQPLYALVFAILGLAALLCGEFNRRGQTKRILVAIGLVVTVEALELGLFNLAAKAPGVIPLMYLNALLPIIIGFYVLLRDPRLRMPSILGGPKNPAGAASGQ
jgi:lipopolysaccharide export system permease protein